MTVQEVTLWGHQNLARVAGDRHARVVSVSVGVLVGGRTDYLLRKVTVPEDRAGSANSRCRVESLSAVTPPQDSRPAGTVQSVTLLRRMIR